MSRFLRTVGVLALSAFAAAATAAPQVQLQFPLNRVVYETSELIDVTVIRTDTAALARGTLTLTLTGKDGSQVQCEFPATAAPVQGATAAAVEHLRLNGALLRPGSYAVTATADGATATGAIEV